MASFIKASLNLSNVPKDKIINGKKGKYIPITITINDDIDQFGNQGPVTVDMTKEERDAKAPKTYLGNVKVVWTNGENVEPAPREGGSGPPTSNKSEPVANTQDVDLPF